MAKLSYKVSYYIMYICFALILVVLGMFYFVGYNNPVGEYNAPEHTGDKQGSRHGGAPRSRQLHRHARQRHRPDTDRSTLLVSQSLQATASSWSTRLIYSSRCDAS